MARALRVVEDEGAVGDRGDADLVYSFRVSELVTVLQLRPISYILIARVLSPELVARLTGSMLHSLLGKLSLSDCLIPTASSLQQKTSRVSQVSEGSTLGVSLNSLVCLVMGA